MTGESAFIIRICPSSRGFRILQKWTNCWFRLDLETMFDPVRLYTYTYINYAMCCKCEVWAKVWIILLYLSHYLRVMGNIHWSEVWECYKNNLQRLCKYKNKKRLSSKLSILNATKAESASAMLSQLYLTEDQALPACLVACISWGLPSWLWWYWLWPWRYYPSHGRLDLGRDMPEEMARELNGTIS